MGAGLLPISIHNNKLYFLLGKENKYYRIENKQLTVDNLENRFVKYGIKYIYIQHNKIFNFIQKVLSKKLKSSC